MPSVIPQVSQGLARSSGRDYRDLLWGLIDSPLAVVQGFRLMGAGEGLASVFFPNEFQGGFCRWRVPAIRAWDTKVGFKRNRSFWFPAFTFPRRVAGPRPEARPGFISIQTNACP